MGRGAAQRLRFDGFVRLKLECKKCYLAFPEQQDICVGSVVLSME